MKNNKRFNKLLGLGLIATSLGGMLAPTLTGCNKNQPTVESDLQYRLDFNDTDLGKDVSNSKYGNATVVGSNKTVDGKIHSNNSIKFGKSGHNSNYISVPSAVLNNVEEATVAMWVKLPANYSDFSNKAPLLSIECESGNYIYISPFDQETWNSYGVHTRINGEVSNLTNVDLDPKAWGNAPVVGTMQSTFGTWQHLAITFTAQNLIIYQNGKKLLSYSGNYSFANQTIKNIFIGTSSFVGAVNDFDGSIADFRIYKKCLDTTKIVSEYELTYKDFLTADYAVKDGKFKDSIRGAEGQLNGQAKITDGAVDLVESKDRSWVVLPKDSLMGHNQLTVSADLFVRQARSYSRLFEFGSSKAGRYISTYLGFTQEDAHKLRYEYVPNKSITENAREYLMNEHSTYLTRQWMNLTLTIRNGLAVLYLNGIPVAESEMVYNVGTLYNFTDDDFHCILGRTNIFNDVSLDGLIKNFKMYSVALTPYEVANENKLIHTIDDEIAVTTVMNSVNSPLFRGENKILLDSVLYDGVRIQATPLDNKQLVDQWGYVYYQPQATQAKFRLTFSRNNVSKSKDVTITLRAAKTADYIINNVDLTETAYTGERYTNAMNMNFEDMFVLDTEDLLYSYRNYAGLSTGTGRHLFGWIRENCGGEGQFESQYVGTLARLSRSMPDKVASTESSYKTAVSRCIYMIDELKKCQDAFDGTDQEGMLNAFPHECFEALANGIQGGTAPGTKCTVWVPYYMHHKNMMMCYDVYTYLTTNDSTLTEAVEQTRQKAYTMLKKDCLWVYNHIKDLNEKRRNYILEIEYGGMGEVLYLAYDLVKTLEPNDTETAEKILYAARFFEESDLITYMYLNINMLTGRHVNTQIPKMLAACAAYKATGDEYYLTAAENFFDICANHMSYADGGLSDHEHFDNPDCVKQTYWADETCCSYNMMRLANYLFKFTGDTKYAQYFEKVFLNHIMGSINTIHGTSADNWNAGKLYSTSSGYGYHKVFSDNRPDFDEKKGAFWCCACTGQETFAKLTYGNYYLGTGDKANDLYINMYNPTTFKNTAGTIDVAMTGDLTEFETDTVTLTVNKAPAKLHLIIPEWCAKDKITITKDGGAVTTTEENGYLIIDAPAVGDYSIKFTKSFRFITQRGNEEITVGDTKYMSACVFYGPTMYMANLTPTDFLEAEHYVKAYDQYDPMEYFEKMRQLGKLDQAIDQHIRIDCKLSEFTKEKVTVDGDYNFKIDVTYHDPEKGCTLTFTPFSIIKNERYSMYMFWHFNEETL